jgi:hypothetical protein
MKSRAETSAHKRFAKRSHEHACASEPNFSGMRGENEPKRTPWLAMKTGLLALSEQLLSLAFSRT